MNIKDAYLTGDLELIKAKSTYGSKHDYTDAFYDACLDGKLSIVRYLYDYAKEHNYPHSVSLYYACKGGNMEIIKYLVEECKESNFNEGLCGACVANDIKIAKYMIELGVNNFNTAFSLPRDCSSVKFIKYLEEEHRDINRAFNIVCRYGNVDILKYLIDKYKDVSLYYVFETTCKHGNTDILKYLLEECKLNDKPKIYIGFLKACKSNNIDLVKYLVDHNYVTGFKIGLHCALSSHSFKIAKYLIDKGADITSASDDAKHALLNLGVDSKKLRNVYGIVEKRNTRNVNIKKILLEVTVMCTNVIDLVCDFTEY